jgi:2-keto-4-pentenoate hydratase/2-oxohepta-3-ene-1,7-dioic acid hydratase in catechol pathway
MKRVRFRDSGGMVRTGEWHTDGIRYGTRTYEPEEVGVLPPTEPSKFVCVGINYPDIFDEVELERPERPFFFLKSPNALAGHGDTVTLLPGKEEIFHEGELAVVIGEQCRNVPREDAMDVVRGFTCLNDVTNMDDLVTANDTYDWVRTKAFDNAAPFGPVVASPDEVPGDATIELRINGERRQQSSRDELIFSVPEIVEAVTAYMTLEPGDVVATGTPSGIAAMTEGDTVEVEIEGIGTLEHEVRRGDA